MSVCALHTANAGWHKSLNTFGCCCSVAKQLLCGWQLCCMCHRDAGRAIYSLCAQANNAKHLSCYGKFCRDLFGAAKSQHPGRQFLLVLNRVCAALLHRCVLENNMGSWGPCAQGRAPEYLRQTLSQGALSAGVAHRSTCGATLQCWTWWATSWAPASPPRSSATARSCWPRWTARSRGAGELIRVR